MKFSTALLLALVALAQDAPPPPEIHGTVTEYGTNAPIAAAEVILYEFVTIDNVYGRKQVATIVTDSKGIFTLKPEHPGNFFAEAKKPAYLTAEEQDGISTYRVSSFVETSLTITRDRVPDIHFVLIRPGGITGRVIDEDGKPVTNFTVTATIPGVPESASDKASTDADGIFTFAALVPAPRIVRIGLDDYRPLAANLKFSKEDIEKVDEDVETTYWPGGATDPALALPINVIPGNIVNAGTIRLRKATSYRAHLMFGDECRSVSGVMVDQRGYAARGCVKEMLLEKLSPGIHKLSLWTNGSEQGEIAAWAVATFTIGRGNVEVPVVFTPATDVLGRIVNANGGPPLATDNAAVRLDPQEGSGGRLHTSKPGLQGDFTVPNVAWLRNRVYFEPLPPGLTIKEIRYNNQLAPDGVIAVAPGALLEIVLDDQPAQISGTAPPDSRIYVARWPSIGVAGAPYLTITAADSAGAFRVSFLAAGEYRALAVPGSSPFIEPAKLVRLLSASPKITLDRGSQQSVELKSTDPTR